MCYYFIINSKNFFPPRFLRQGTTKILNSFFSTKLFTKVFQLFFYPSQDNLREFILSNLSFRERAFLQKRVQRYRTFSIKQIIPIFFWIIFWFIFFRRKSPALYLILYRLNGLHLLADRICTCQCYPYRWFDGVRQILAGMHCNLTTFFLSFKKKQSFLTEKCLWFKYFLTLKWAVPSPRWPFGSIFWRILFD